MMRTRIVLHAAFAIALAALGLASPPAAAPARAVCADFTLSCENGVTYPFCPIAISSAGDVVTGLLELRPRRAVHMRLIPMGAGYRYAGRGVWFDGQHAQAELSFGPHQRLGCTVTRGNGEVAVLVTKG